MEGLSRERTDEAEPQRVWAWQAVGDGETVTRVFYPDRPDRTGEVRYRFTGPVRSGTGQKPDEFKFEFKPRSTIGSDRYTDRFHRYTDWFDRFPIVEKN
jgi:hypothetical protein